MGDAARQFFARRSIPLHRIAMADEAGILHALTAAAVSGLCYAIFLIPRRPAHFRSRFQLRFALGFVAGIAAFPVAFALEAFSGLLFSSGPWQVAAVAALIATAPIGLALRLMRHRDVAESLRNASAAQDQKQWRAGATEEERLKLFLAHRAAEEHDESGTAG